MALPNPPGAGAPAPIFGAPAALIPMPILPFGVCPRGERCPSRLDGGRPCGLFHQNWCGFGSNCLNMFFGCRANHPSALRIYYPTGTPPLYPNKVFLDPELACYQDPIGVTSTDAVKMCLKNGFSCYIKTGVTNPHSKGWALRLMIIREMVSRLFKDGYREFALPFDFTRTASVIRRVNRVCDYDARNGILYSDINLAMCPMDMVRSNIRTIGTRQTLSQCDCLIFNDQYIGVMPEHIASYLRLIRQDRRPCAYLSCIQLRGPMGVVAFQEFEFDPRTGLYNCHADDMQQPYQHSPMEWIYTHNYVPVAGGFLTITHLVKIEGKDVFKLELTNVLPLQCFSLHEKFLDLEFTTNVVLTKNVSDYLPLPYRLKAFDKELERVSFVVFAAFYHQQSINFSCRNYSSHNNSVARKALFKLGEADPDIAALIKRFGLSATQLLTQTVESIILGDRRRTVRDHDLRMHFCRTVLSRQREQRRDLDAPLLPDKPIKKFAWLLAGVFGFILLARYFKRVPLLGRLLATAAIPWSPQRRAEWAGSDSDRELSIKTMYLTHSKEEIGRLFWGGLFRRICDRSWLSSTASNLVRECFIGPVVESFIYGPSSPLPNWPIRFGVSLAAHFLDHGVVGSVLNERPDVGKILFRIIGAFIGTTPWWLHIAWNTMITVVHQLGVISHDQYIFTQHAKGSSARFALVALVLLFAWRYRTKILNRLRRWFCPLTAWDKYRSLRDSEDYIAARYVDGSSSVPLNSLLKSTRSHATHYKSKVDDPDIKVECRHVGQVIPIGILLDEEDHCRRVIQPVLITNGTLYAPCTTLRGTALALLTRNKTLTPVTNNPEVWSTVSAQVGARLSEQCVDSLEPVPVQDWLNSFSGQKKRVYTAFVEDDNNGLTKYSFHCGGEEDMIPADFLKALKNTRMFLKPDETLKLIQTDGTFGLNGRIIVSVPLAAQLSTQPWIRACTERFKMALREPFPVTIRGHTIMFKFMYASGIVGTHLSDWLEESERLVQQGITCAAICGDDSQVVTPNADDYWVCSYCGASHWFRHVSCPTCGGQRRGVVKASSGLPSYLSIDYSQFDQSQKIDQILAQHAVMHALGVPTAILEILMHLARSNTYGGKQSPRVSTTLKLKRPGPTRITGAPDTSLGNSLTNMMGIIIAKFQNFTQAGWDEVGFKAVVTRSETIDDATFLRGRWWLCLDGRRRWGIMPSAVSKRGKVMIRLKNQPQVEMMAYSLAQGMGTLPAGFPILHNFQKKLYSLGVDFRGPKPKFLQCKETPHKPLTQFPEELDVHDAHTWFCRHYHVSADELAAAEKLIVAVDSLPFFIGHRVFRHMMADYE